MKLMPVWAQAAIVVVIVAAVFGAGWMTASWKASGTIERLTAERDAAVLERDEKRAFAEACAEDVLRIGQDLKAMETARNEAERLYRAAVDAPPKRVVVYRDRWHEAEDVIISQDCPEAVGQLVTFLHSLPMFTPEVTE